MLKIGIASMFILCSVHLIAQISITEVAELPVRISNNAVSEGFIEGKPYLYSFGGIDSSKKYSGIHLKSYRFNIDNNTTIQIPNLPDTLGKIAAAASRIGNTIYISGGYHVFQNNTEISSNKMHRYDIISNTYLADGKNIPVATDDHVQAVWRDSLIYLITGWSNTGNIPDVQIYNPSLDAWEVGTAIPNNHFYKSFGASGTISGDTIYYFGGASSGSFGPQNQLRKGVINPQEPIQIDWSISVPDSSVKGYRMAATKLDDFVYWVGGSKGTYNYDGIAYNGSGGVPPSDRVLFTAINNLSWGQIQLEEIPMDLRGIAEINDSVKYVAGGMLENQWVSNKIFKIELENPEISGVESSMKKSAFDVYPNPAYDLLLVKLEVQSKMTLQIRNVWGQTIKREENLDLSKPIDIAPLASGVYFLEVFDEKRRWSKSFIKI